MYTDAACTARGDWRGGEPEREGHAWEIREKRERKREISGH